MLQNREWNKKQKHKKQPWSNVECFAFGVGIVRFASLETSFHAANHTILPPPSHEGSSHCPKDKNRSPSAKNQSSEIRLSENANKKRPKCEAFHIAPRLFCMV
ncbi:MAG: hypothetical protein SO575_09910, partial [Sodaliphilus sp.]|nr:hypothetical protein [Sodaliphilus sp.]